ncbi:hypothetical protein PU02_1023 [Bartonella ancashensis]|uniref:Uncharacterized protein n=1 Tax=Bartonella ancashensis TaxID=1318743 RepID=A0A0M4M421_9HYPH|nr:hypothetical protein PU02_1023 [Bartonella ancashensis]
MSIFVSFVMFFLFITILIFNSLIDKNHHDSNITSSSKICDSKPIFAYKKRKNDIIKVL